MPSTDDFCSAMSYSFVMDSLLCSLCSIGAFVHYQALILWKISESFVDDIYVRCNCFLPLSLLLFSVSFFLLTSFISSCLIISHLSQRAVERALPLINIKLTYCYSLHKRTIYLVYLCCQCPLYGVHE
ncbi:hypothetical protein BT96DRAFT_122535 [Gymnopus androsaceus JB14]|uniref:Uncharacterized protein n=1 Tax=Gymnopus androsaceus JB14 TaxID=1447944 RepID=A0A6A4HCJ9_9AGAR|nr:hypothetical protein BT96DRAFT_122535 [Gymnopus androsaceus JB14]